MAEIFTGVAGNTISSVVIAPLIQLIQDVIDLDQNTQLLQDKLSSTRILLQDMSNQFEHDQRSPPNVVTDRLQKIHQSLEDAKSVIGRSQQQKWCLDCFACKPRVSTQIRAWTTNFDELLNNVRRDFQLFCAAQQMALSATQRPEALLQPVPDSGFVGLGIKDAEKMVQTWLNTEDHQLLNTEDHQFRVIGIYGLGGIGKTALLKTVYNTYKTGNVFQAVLWITISQTPNILNMQKVIAGPGNLDLHAEGISDSEMLKMRISTSMKNMKFLVVLDDMWKSLDLEEVGIPVGNDKGSRVIISTRSRDVIRRMGTNDFSIQIKPLSEEEGWELFCRKAFKDDGRAPTKSIEDLARLIAGECKGLPLAINVVAAAMIGNSTVDEWDRALSHMKSVDPVFLNTSGIEEDLYRKLKWSYDRLPDRNFQNCFLYCGAFPEDEVIEVETLVEMWAGEGLLQSRETSYLIDTGRQYVKLLVDRCLFEDVHGDMRLIKAHDIVRDMAIYIAEKEENCFFRTGQHLQRFPVENGMDSGKRIAMGYNAIPFLPTDLTCPRLLALLLPENQSLTEVPNGFFLNLTSLRVLDMSRTKIESLPGSMWHLTQLEYLALSSTPIKNLPGEICNLGRLQFLHLSGCRELESLPSTIGELKTLKHLDLGYCERLTEIPREISQLTSLNRLNFSGCRELKSLPSTIGELKTLKHLDLEECSRLTEIPREISQLTSLTKLNLWNSNIFMNTDEGSSGVCSLKDLRNMPNLMELTVRVKAGSEVDAGIKSGIKVGTMGTWVEMRRLTLGFHVDGLDDDDVVEDLPEDMHNMKKLQSFILQGYCGRSLPNCICDFNQLEELLLYSCSQLRELPLLERLPNLKSLTLHFCSQLRELGIGRWGSAGVGFPMLESLDLIDLPRLESMRSSSSNIVWSEGLMPKLHSLYISDCPSLKRVPEELAKLPNLREIRTYEAAWWEGLIWEDDDVKKTFEDKLRKPVL